jgi:hypothetical protein
MKMPIKIPILYMFICVTFSAKCESLFPPEDLKRVQTFFESKISSRYMEHDCKPATFKEWEGFSTELCTYSVKDKKTGVKTAQVILLDASPEKLAKWVLSTCQKVLNTTSKKCTGKLSNWIIGASGAQFPVSGIVFEDQFPQKKPPLKSGDGIMEIYCFRNGVTVKVEGVPHMGTDQPSEQEKQDCINGTVSKTLRYARIASTQREDSVANGGKEDVKDNKWNEVVKRLYQIAINSEENELVNAWAQNNKKILN